MLLGVVARAFRRVAEAAGFEFEAALGSPTATVAYQGDPASVDIATALGSPFGAKGHQASAGAYAFDTALGTPTAITGKSGSAEAVAFVTGMGEPTATVAYQGLPADIEVVTALGEPSADGFDSDAQAIIDEMTSAPSSARETAINDLVVGLKDDGIWSKLDRLWVMAAHDAQAARLDWKNPATSANALTAVNSPTFTADQGYTGDGSSSYLNTNFNPNANGSGFALNSAHFGVWVRTIDSSNSLYFGANDNSGLGNEIGLQKATSGVRAFLNGISTGFTTNATGLWVINRSGSNTNNLYKDGSSVVSDGDAASGVTNSDVFLLANNNQAALGVPNNYSSGQISVAFAGGSLTATEQSNLYSRLNTYMGAL